VTGGVVTKYYYAGASRVAMRQNGTLYFLLSDHLGSTSLTTDEDGDKLAGLRYDAWGAVRYVDGTTPAKYTYTGQFSYMADFGLMFFNARFYDPALGRFSQADTIIPNPNNPLDWDRYQFVRSNPIKYTDPTGHYVAECGYYDCIRSEPPKKNHFDFTSEWDGLIDSELLRDLQNVFNGAATMIGNAIAPGLNRARAMLCKSGETEYCSRINADAAFSSVFGRPEITPSNIGSAAQANGISEVFVNHYRDYQGQIKSSVVWIVRHPLLAVHELGHVFLNNFGGGPGEYLNQVPGFSRKPGDYGSTANNFNGFGGGRYQNQFSLSNQLNLSVELFADMFLGWANGSLSTERFATMDALMYSLLYAIP
jgi:RHS repeat-associated protein